MSAYAYLRKSSVHDPSREVSYEMQEAAVRALASRYGDDNDALVLLSDWDKSGKLGPDKRPGYRALLDAIESGQATAVYSYSLSRLARSVQELSRLIADCARRDIPVRLDRDHVDTSTASGKLLANVLSSVAQFESDIASERVRGANASKVARGESLSTARSYGDEAGDDTAAVIAAFREAGSFSGAAKLLNARNVKTTGRQRRASGDRQVWWHSTVSVVVKRLDPSIGNRRPTRGYAAGGTDFVLARLLRCPTCGTMLTGTKDRGGKRIRYSCRLGTSLPHARISVTEHLIMPAIVAEAARVSLPGQVQMAEAASSERAALDARKTRILDLFEAGHIDRADRERRLSAVQEALERLDDRKIVAAIPTLDWTWPPRQVNTVLRALFSTIDLDKTTFQPAPTGFQWTVPEWRS